MTRTLRLRIAIAAVMIVVLVLAAMLLRAPFWAAWLIATNIVTALFYALDKRAAGQGGWRVPENLLHCLALIGGTPAAFACRRFMRHKTHDRSFLIWAWLIAVIQIAISIAFVIWRMN